MRKNIIPRKALFSTFGDASITDMLSLKHA